MPRAVELGAEVAEELRGIVAQFERTEVATQFVDDIERALAVLARLPGLGAPYPGDTRRLSLRRFPFGLVYQVAEERVVILAIAHERRRPGYWRPRKR